MRGIGPQSTRPAGQRSLAPVRNMNGTSPDVNATYGRCRIWDNERRQLLGTDRNLIADVSGDVGRDREVRDDGTSHDRTARYLERLLTGANTTWAMVQRRWPDAPAPARFDRLDKRQAGALVATATFRPTTPWMADHPDGSTQIDAAG